jgi:hypothetical protein
MQIERINTDKQVALKVNPRQSISSDPCPIIRANPYPCSIIIIRANPSHPFYPCPIIRANPFHPYYPCPFLPAGLCFRIEVLHIQYD